MPKLWSPLKRIGSLFRISQICGLREKKASKKNLVKLAETLQKHGLRLGQSGRQWLLSFLKKLSPQQLAKTTLRVCCQCQPRLTWVRVGQQYKLARKLVATGAATLMLMAAGVTDSYGQQRVENVGNNITLQFFGANQSAPGWGNTGVQNWTDAQVEATRRAANVWSEAIGNTAGRRITIAVVWANPESDENIAGNNGYGGGASFPTSANPTTINGNSVNYAEAVWRHGRTDVYPGGAADIRIVMNAEINDWTFDVSRPNSDQRDFSSVISHEIAHGLGFLATAVSTDDRSAFSRFSTLNAYTRNLRDNNDPNRTPIVTAQGDPQPANQMAVNGPAGETVFWSGGVGSFLYGGSIPIFTNTTWTPGSSLSHTAMPSTMLNAGRGTGVMTRALLPHEIGMFYDMGWNMNFSYLNSYAGAWYTDDGEHTYSGGDHTSSIFSGNALYLYGDGNTLNVGSVLTSDPDTTLTATGDVSNVIGVVGSRNEISIRSATLNAEGFESAGIDLFGSQNTVTTGTASWIEVTGERSTGVLVRGSGNNNHIVHRGTILATGHNASGVHFMDGTSSRLSLSGALVSNDGPAILVNANSRNGVLDVLSGAWIFGDITGHGTGWTINFGNVMEANGQAGTAADPNFMFFYSGDINGAAPMAANFLGGRGNDFGTNLSGETRFQRAFVGADGKLTADGKFSTVENVTVSGDVVVTSDGILESGTSFTNNASGLVVNNGRIRTVLEFSNSGSLVNNQEGHLNVGAFYQNDINGFLANLGVVDTNSFFVNSGLVNNSGVIESGDFFDNHGTINNSGTIKSAREVETYAGSRITNTGSILSGSEFWNRGEIANSGTIRASLEFNNYEGGSIANEGRIETEDSFLNVGLITENSGLIQSRTGFVNSGVVQNNTGTVAVTDGGAILNHGSIFENEGGRLNAQNGNIDILGELSSRDGYVNASGNVTVYDGGHFKGTPRISAQLVDNQTGGTLTPGNSIGIMTVDGDFQSSGKIEYELTSQNIPLDSDLIRVINNGSAAINNNTPSYEERGEFDFYLEPGSYDIARRYTILETENDGNLVVVQRPQTKDDVDHQRVILRSDKDVAGLYTPDARLYYAYIGRDVPFADIAQTPNQKSLGEFLDTIKTLDDGTALGDEVQWLRDTLDLIVSEDDVRDAMNQMSGSFYGSISPMVIQQMHMNYGRIAAGMRNNSGMCSYGEVDGEPIGLYGTVTGFGTGGHVSGDGNASGYRFGGGGTQAIVAYGQDGLQMGGIYTYTGGSLRGAGRAGVEMHEFGGFVLAKGEDTHFLFAAGGGYAGYDVNRMISFGNTDIQEAYTQQNSGNLNVGLASLYTEYGEELMFDSFALRPFIGLGYVHVGGDALAEQGGSLQLAGRVDSLNSLRSVVGTDVSICLTSIPGTVLDLRAAWMHEFQGDRSGTVTSGFGAGMGGNFTAHGVDMGSDFATLGATLSHSFMSGRARVFGGYDLTINSDQDLHTGNGGIEFLW